MRALFYMLAYGIKENYPLCCIRQFLRESLSGQMPGELRYAEAGQRLAVWSGTGYVPCSKCAAAWVR